MSSIFDTRTPRPTSHTPTGSRAEADSTDAPTADPDDREEPAVPEDD